MQIVGILIVLTANNSLKIYANIFSNKLITASTIIQVAETKNDLAAQKNIVFLKALRV